MTKKNLGKLAHFKLMRKLLMRISGSDLIAQEAKYHLTCLFPLYRKADHITCGGSDSDESNQTLYQSHGIVFAQVVAYISNCRTQDSRVVYRLADILKPYNKAQESQGVSVDTRSHSTRWKNCIVCSITFWILRPKTQPAQLKMCSACFQRQC